MKTISNRDSSTYVESQTPFKANNLSGDFENDCFVVRSYTRYPIFICKSGQWYENKNGYSNTTKRQMFYCRQNIDTILKTTNELNAIINEGKKEDSSLKLMKAFLKMGELTPDKGETLEDKVKYKERIVFSTMRSQIVDWQAPNDWDTISDEDKLKRLIKLEEVI